MALILCLIAGAASIAVARTTPGALPEVALAALPKEAQEVYALIGKGGPFHYDRDGVVFGNRERLLPAKAARILSRVHGAHAGRQEPRRAAHHLRRTGTDPGRVLLHRRPLPVVPEDPPMKLPDLHDLEISGVHAWHGDMHALAASRGGGQAPVPSCRPQGGQQQDRAAGGAGEGIQAARAFRQQLGRARRFGRGRRMARQARLRDRARRTRPRTARRTASTGRRSRTSSPRPPTTGASGTSRSGSSSRKRVGEQDPRLRAGRRPHAGPACPADRACRCGRLLAIGDGQPGSRRIAGGDRGPRAPRGDGHRCRAPTEGSADWQMSNVYEIYPRWRHRYPPGTTHNTEHVFALEVPGARSGPARAARASGARLAAVARRPRRSASRGRIATRSCACRNRPRAHRE